MKGGQVFHVSIVEHYVGNLLGVSVVYILYQIKERFQYLLVMVVLYALSSR